MHGLAPSNKITLSNFFNDHNAPLTKVVFNEANVIRAIDKMKHASSPGPDKITPYFLKMTKLIIAKFLSNVFNKSMETGEVPQSFKEAIVTPIFKGGDNLDPKSYRPISLTSHLVKIMERVIKEEIMSYLDNNNLLNNIQHGFRPGRSTVSALLNHYQSIINALESGHCMDTVLLDYSKAFDRVHHSILLRKVKELGINGVLGRWIGGFLLGRKQAVKVNGRISDWIDVLSGVPQGSILGPLLFIIFINDINSAVRKSTMSCYADDSKASMKITNDNDKYEFQNELNQIFDWSNENSMSFNKEKLEFIHFSRKQSDYDHRYSSFDGSLLNKVDFCKDLGLYFDSDASFTTHITGKCSKARKLCGYIFRTFRSRDVAPMMKIFKSIVLPVIEYCCVIWNPSQLYNIRKIESVQRDFTSRIHGLDQMSYWERLVHLKIYSLERRRERYIILYAFKIIAGLVPNPGITWHFSLRRGVLIDIPFISQKSSGFAQSLKFNSFFCKTARLFNCLPIDVRALTGSVDSIKYNLDNFLRKVPDEPRLVGYTQSARSCSNSIYDQIMYANT